MKFVSLVLGALPLSLLQTAAGQNGDRFKRRVFARYNGPAGRRMARRCAKKMVRDLDADDIVVFEGDDACFNQLAGAAEMLDVEWDNEIVPLGTFDGFFEGSVEEARRSLQEATSWALEMIQADQLDAGPNPVTVCVVDSGIAHQHPDLNSENIDGTDFETFFGPPRHWDYDGVGHGTHVAGIMAAKVGNGIGIAGVSDTLRIHITRALDDQGGGYETDISTAVEQCVEAGAKIINLSLGGPRMNSRSARLYHSVVHDYGAIMVAAAGNDGNSDPVFPASHPDIISVGAVYEWGEHWPGSNTGVQVELAAPGHRVLSTYATTAVVKFDTNGSETIFHAATISNTLKAYATGKLKTCDATKCNVAGGHICLMSKAGNDRIAAHLDYCKEQGGIGAVIFSDDGSEAFDNWAVNPAHEDIVAVGIKTSDATDLIANFKGQFVTIGDAGGDDQEYSYAYLTGTSMASPHVAAAAALVWSHFPDCSNHQIRYALAYTAQHPNGDGVCEGTLGHGIVKAKDAYDWLDAQPSCTEWTVDPISQGGCTTAASAIIEVSGMSGV